MPRYINLDELLTAIDQRNGRLPLWLDEILIEDCKVVDAVEVVRCKDCVHKNPYSRYEFSCKCLRDNLHHNTDDYCSYGKRKEAVNDQQKT